MPSSIEYVVPVIDQMIRLKVFFGLGGFNQILALVVHGVRHNISCIVTHYCIFADGKASSETNTRMLGRKSFNEVVWVHRQTADLVLTVLVDAVVLVTDYCGCIMCALWCEAGVLVVWVAAAIEANIVGRPVMSSVLVSAFVARGERLFELKFVFVV